MPRGGYHPRTGGKHPYNSPVRAAEDDRVLLNWLSTRVTEDGMFCHPDHEHEHTLIEHHLRLAKSLGLTVQPGIYLPRPELSLKDRKTKAA